MHSSNINLGDGISSALCVFPLTTLCADSLSSNGGTCISDSEYQLCDCTTAMQDGFKYGKFRRAVSLYSVLHELVPG